MPKGIEHRAAGASAFGRRAVMKPADVGYARLAIGRAFMIYEFVILERKCEITTPGMANDIHPRLIHKDRQLLRKSQRFYVLDVLVELEQRCIVMILVGTPDDLSTE